MKQLLIIGNGFDLHAGLKTTYADFFEQRISKDAKKILDSFWEEMGDYDLEHLNYPNYSSTSTNSVGIFFNYSSQNLIKRIEKISNFKITNLTFWDIYFYYKELNGVTEWNNIEKQIHSFVTGSSENYAEDNMKSFFYISRDTKTQSKTRTIIASIFSTSLFSKRSIKDLTAVDFLMNELNLLEKGFIEYIEKQLENHKYYFENTRKLLTSLVVGAKYFLDKTPLTSPELIKEMFPKTSLINFNYTEPIESFLPSLNPDPNLKLLGSIKGADWNHIHNNEIQVHGSIYKNNIIFGIDSNKIKPSKTIYRFTKTYRQLISDYSSFPTPGILPNNNYGTSDVIILSFYGHSLSSLDYSYFKSLFDYYSIYDSNIHLIFYYNVYGKRTEQEIKTEQVNRVINLISAYSETLPQGHGENLLHKLSLERRLSVVKLELAEKEWNLQCSKD